MEHENLNTPQNPPQQQTAVTCSGFSVGDRVNTPYAGVGIIWKITDDFIHVKHRYRKEGIEWLYTKYLKGETVYPQYSVSAISHCR
jgi:hypothetical protein